MFRKENTPPSKQGIFYHLNLNKNSGPFLPKDIMYSNPISNNLLTTQSRLNDHRTMTENVNNLEINSKNQKTSQSKTQNFSTIVKYCDEELERCSSLSQFLGSQQRKFKEEIDGLYERISNTNNQLLESSMIVLKNLLKKVKESNQADKAEYYKIQKELQSIEMQKRSLEHIMLNCSMRIQELEKSFGIQVEGEPMAFYPTSIKFCE